MLALANIARGVLQRLGFGGVRTRVLQRVALTGGATAGGVGIGNVLFGTGDDGRPRRRRRKRVLTSGDRSDIAFIVATLGASAGKSFALIIAAKTA